MNTRYQSIWSAKTGTFVAVSENAKTGGKKAAGRSEGSVMIPVHCTLKVLTTAILLSAGFNVYALPVGGAVSAGSATIGSGGSTTTITQTSQNAAINWQSFNIGTGESVNFVQPNSSATTLNRVLGSDPSSILGGLNANGKVFLVNPNGVVFGQGASVNVGGLVGSTRNITDSDFMAGKYNFEGTGDGSVVNYGSINANGGSVALLGANVSNQGVIQAQLGTVALAAGNSFTLDVAGDGLLNVAVNNGAVDALVQNGGLIQADGGRVLMTAQSANNLLTSSVNNTGVIRAQTIENRNGTIMLMGDMQSGTVNVAGTLDASAPNGGSGGFIETSAAHVNVANGSTVTTLAPAGTTGTWLIDPLDFVVSSSGNISGTTLSNNLQTSNVTYTNAPGAGNGDILVEEPVTWTAPTTLTLSASRDVVVQAAITTTGGNLALIAGRDINQNATVTATGGASGGDITMVAGRNVNVNAMFTATNGNVLLVGANDGTGVGTVNFASGIKPAVTGPLSTVRIYYAPVSYATPTDFTGNFTLSGGATLTPFMWVFVQADDKVYDGNNAATLSLQRNPALAGDVALQAGTATFDSPNVGTGKTVNYSGYSLGGADANLFALFAPFDSLTAAPGTPGSGITLANITPAPLTITANDATKEFGQTIVLPTSGFTSTGLVNNETVGSVTVTSPGTVATAPITGNPYRITPSNATAGTFNPANYLINYVQGTLLITAAPVTTPIDPTPVDPTDPGSTPPGSTPTDPTPTDPTPTDPGSTPPGSTPADPTPTSPTPTSPGSTSPVTTVPGSTSPVTTVPVSTSPVTTVPGSTSPVSTPIGSTPTDSTSPGTTSPGTSLPELPVASNQPGLPVQAYRGATTPDTGNSGDPDRPLATAYPNHGNSYAPLLPALTVVGTGINVPGNQLAQVTPILPVPVKASEKVPAHQIPYVYKAPVYLPKQERN
ncbi:filamentous hemagglutinin N-terminal domain-containing protein [Pseudomonas sp. DWP3-1-2]|uniref:two-partner secretion domain-containing protein n=1 Tax=Pseudomonas sp. DWP3-1-2 TaxID=2804645 RepID=UPI003CF2857B